MDDSLRALIDGYALLEAGIQPDTPSPTGVDEFPFSDASGNIHKFRRRKSRRKSRRGKSRRKSRRGKSRRRKSRRRIPKRSKSRRRTSRRRKSSK